MTAHTCSQCRYFWNSHVVSKIEAGPFQGAEDGECCVNPPNLMLIPAGIKSSMGPQGVVNQQLMEWKGMSPPCISLRPACEKFSPLDGLAQ